MIKLLLIIKNKPNDGLLWLITKSLIIWNVTILPLIRPDGTLAISDFDTANIFSAHLAQFFIPQQNPNQCTLHDIFVVDHLYFLLTILSH